VAKALTRPRGRRSRTSDRHERDLKRLLLSICDDTGFRLYLATYDHPKRRNELIERVMREAEPEKVRVTQLDLAEAGPETNLVGLLRSHLKGTRLPSGGRQAVMVTGIEQRLDYARGSEGYAFLHQANLLRDALPEVAPVPVVLWLSRLASAALPAEAPDLWHWRAANFDFTGDEAPRLELLRELTTLHSEEEGGLSDEQRRTRLRMLEELLAELEREGPPKTKRQMAERAELLARLVVEEVQLGRAAEAIPHVERALEYAREMDDLEVEAAGLVLLGRICAQLGHKHRAVEHLKMRLAVARKSLDRSVQSSALLNLGNAYAALDETQRAIESYDQLLAIAHELGDRNREREALYRLGRAYAALGETQRAIEYYQQCIPIAHELGDRQGEAAAIGGLGANYAALGEFQRAIDPLEQQLAITREIGNRRREGVALVMLGLAYAGSGEVPRAIRHIEQALAIAREAGDAQLEGNSLFTIARLLDHLGERNEAIRRMEESLRIFEQIEDPWREEARAQLAEWRGEGGG
jgi:tetratricopeptide (TPR) repeat protein